MIELWGLLPDWLRLLLIVLIFAIPTGWYVAKRHEEWMWNYDGPKEDEENGRRDYED